MQVESLFLAFILPLVAGLFTGIGGLIVLFTRRADKNFLAVCISFSAGVMIYISFVEIFHHAYESLEYVFGEMGFAWATLAFFGGIVLSSIIDKIVPHEEEALEAVMVPKTENNLSRKDVKTLKRMGVMTAIAVSVHNFPEGIVTFMAALHDPAVGIGIAVAIGIHNIPEGIAVAAPIHYATGSRKKAMLWSLAAGITEPLGALAAFLFVRHIFNDTVLGIVFAVVGGIMVYISFHQLLPTAIKFGKHHTVMKGLFAGMAVMAASLLVI